MDDPSQQRIRNEAEAVEQVLDLVGKGRVTWDASVVIELELNRNPDSDKRHDALVLDGIGYKAFDALHLACAEQLQADVFLTTDDRLIRLAARNAGNPNVKVMNPINWIQEVKHGRF